MIEAMKKKCYKSKAMKYSVGLVWCLLVAVCFQLEAQNRVLVFHKTNGFRHGGAITEGIKLIENSGDEGEIRWETDNSADASVFSDVNLEKYQAIVFLNTSGDNLLNDTQQKALEDFIADGKGFVGVHAATDTYRDRSWPYYNELVGGIVQTRPNHTANNFQATMTVNDKTHPAASFLGDTWSKGEEYYYWERNGGQLFDGNNVMLTVERTGSQSYDAARPIAWSKEYGGGRSFYTALGHNGSDYQNNSLFQQHLINGLIWAAQWTIPVPIEQLLDEGTYTVESPEGQALTSDMVMSNNVSVEDKDNSNRQRWEVSHLGNNEYTFKNLSSNRFLEVPQAKCEPEANVATWTSANKNHQRFSVRKEGNFYYLIPLHCTQLAVDRTRNMRDANVQIASFSTSNLSQRWLIKEVSSNTLGIQANVDGGLQTLFLYTPSQNTLRINGLSGSASVDIMNAVGKVIAHKNVDPQNNEIDIEGLASGMYFLHVREGALRKALKFMHK